jgi:hypothetical protein
VTVSSTLIELKNIMKTSLLTCENIQNDHQAIIVNVTTKCLKLEESSMRLENNVKSLEKSSRRLEMKEKNLDPNLVKNGSPNNPPNPLPNSQPPNLQKNIHQRSQSQQPKDKILWAGSSIGTNVNFRRIERVSGKFIRTRKAYTAVKENNARYPNANLKDVVKKELAKSKYTHCVLATGSIEITDSNTKSLMNIDKLQETVKRASTDIFNVAVEALENNTDLEKVVIIDRAPRIDTPQSDPYGLKSQLSEFGNKVFRELLEQSDLKNRILIGEHNLDKIPRNELFGETDQRKYDGIHLSGKSGRFYYTRSLCQILQKAGILSGEMFQWDGKANLFQTSPRGQRNHVNLNQRKSFQKDGNCKQPDYNTCKKDVDLRYDFS